MSHPYGGTSVRVTPSWDAGRMAEPGVLEFTFTDQPIRFRFGEVETKPFPFTGHDLRTLSTQVTISPPDADLVKAFLATAPLTAGDGSVWTGNIDME